MPRHQGGRTRVLIQAVLALALLPAAGSRGQETGSLVIDISHVHSPPADTTDFGPPPDEGRKTLLQWSYGTSFGGGPDLDKPLVTDRPDFTEASSTVGRGVVQFECGYTYVYDHQGEETTRVHSVGEPLLRVGLGADWFEFRVATNYLSETHRGGAGHVSDSGCDDLYLGLKLGLTPQEGLLPETALAPALLLPTGSPPFARDQVPTPGTDAPSSARRVAAGVNLLYGWELGEEWFLGASSQFFRTDDEETGLAFTQFGQSCVLHRAIGERFDVYGEWFAILPIGADSALPEQYLSVGMVYYLTKNFQVDARCGAGLNDNSDNAFLGVGGAIRFH